MILLGILTILLISGVCECVYLIRLLLYYPKTKTKCYSLVILKRHYAVKQLNFIWQKIKLHGEDFASGIFAVIDELEDDEILECKSFIGNKKIVLSDFDSLFNNTFLYSSGVQKWKSQTQANNEKSME